VVKVLGQAGTSLADVYDVEGSIAGVEQLISAEVGLVHEMGHTLFSERASGAIRRLTSGDILQTITWDITIADLPAGLWRVLGVVVLMDTDRINYAQVSLRSTSDGREMPLFVWDTANDASNIIRIVEDGTLATWRALVGPILQVPNLGIGTGQRQQVGEEIVFRGQSTTFGAGTVEAVALVYLGLTHLAGVSSFGLPIPSW